MKIRCYADDCKHIAIGWYDPSPSGVALASGSFIEVECSKENDFPNDVDEVEYSKNVGKHDGTYRRCPFYETYTKREIKERAKAEEEYLRAEAEYYKSEQQYLDDLAAADAGKGE